MMKILFVAILLILTTAQATEIKEQLGPYTISLSTVLNTTAHKDIIRDNILRINYTIPEGWGFGMIGIVQYNSTLTDIATEFKSNLTRIGYLPQTERYEQIDGHDAVVVPYKDTELDLVPEYYFGYWLDEDTLVYGWVPTEMENARSISESFKLLQRLPRSLRTLHVERIASDRTL